MSGKLAEHHCPAIEPRIEEAKASVDVFRGVEVHIIKMPSGWWLDAFEDWNTNTPINFCPFCGQKLD